MKNLFVYGTLANEALRFHLLKETFRALDATLDSYQRVQVAGKAYPAIRKNKKAKVQGVVVCGLGSHHLRVLDKFEGKHYQRITLSVNAETVVNGNQCCEVYLFKKRYRHLLSKRPWSNELFRTKHLRRYLKRR